MKKNLQIVFIHLGTSIPPYVIKNAERTARISGKETFLFTDNRIENSFSQERRPSNFTIMTLPTVSRIDSMKLEHDISFRNGFWIHTFERLLQLQQIHEILGNDKSILHIESDMLILKTFPFDFDACEKLMWFKHNEIDDVAGILFSPSLKTTRWLNARLIDVAINNPRITDMSALNIIRRNNADLIETFPSLLEQMKKNGSFDLYDGLMLGQWLCGVDPRNTYGITLLHENNGVVYYDGKRILDVLQKAEIEMANKEIIVRIENKVCKLHCLHIHSKSPSLFEFDNEVYLLDYVIKAKDRRITVKGFDLKLFSLLIVDNLKRGMLSSYLRNLVHFLSKKDQDGKSILRILIGYALWK